MNFFNKNLIELNVKTVLFVALLQICYLKDGLAQITISGSNGDDGAYTSLTKAAGAFAALNTGASQAGYNVVITITSDVTTEDGANSLTGAAGMWTSLIISPSGARTISGAPVAGTTLIKLDGADYVTIDGLNTGGNSLIISNTTVSATAGTCAIQFINDAIYNTIKNCTIKGSETSATNGVILVSTTTGITGNDYITIDNCDIGQAGVNLPANCIYSSGTASRENDNISVTNCNIHDFFLATGASGINISSNNTLWTISGNSFYQVADRNGTFNVINIQNTGVGYSISSNYIGGDSPLAAVNTQKFTVNSASAREFNAIYINVGTTSVTTVQSNIIKNISITALTDAVEFFSGIWVYNGNVDVIGNTIGDNLTGSISLSITANGANVAYVDLIQYYGGTARYGDVTNNTIGSITIGGTLTAQRSINGITYLATLAADVNISGNTIGNATTANSINCLVGSIPPSYVAGIYGGSTGSYNINISNNTIANLTEESTSNNTATVMYGIISFDAGIVTINNNTVHDLTSATKNKTDKGFTAYLAFVGIGKQSASASTISNNQVYNMRLTSLTVKPLTYGIWTGQGSSNTIANNHIYNLQSSADGTMVNGIGVANAGVAATISNNMIRLGYNIDGTSNTYATYYAGILKSSSGDCNMYFNSVYIGGTGVNNVATNYSSCFEREQTGTDICKNNIFENTRTNAGAGANHYAIVLNATTTFTSDYNDLYTSAAATLGSYDAGTTARNFATWKVNVPEGVGSINIDPNFIAPTSTTPNLHISPTSCSVADIGLVISGITTDFDGNLRATGIAATFTGPDMGADEYSGDINPNAVLVNCSGVATLTVTDYGAGTLQWMESDDNGATDPWVNAIGGSGSTTDTYTTPVLISDIYYRVAVTNGCTAYTNSVLVMINPTILTQPTPTTACTGLSTSFNISATGTSIEYQWQLSTAGIGGPYNNIADGGVYSGAATATLSISDATGLNGYYYRCKVTSCTTNIIYSDAVLLSVQGLVTRYWAGAGTVLTGGSTGTDFNDANNWSSTGPTGAATRPASVPATCTDVVFTTNNSYTITLSANTTINSLSISHSGTNKVFTLSAGTFILTINGNTSTDVTSGNPSTTLIIDVGSGEIVYGGNTTFAGSAGNGTYCIYSATDGQGSITFKGNVTFNAGAIGTAVRPGIVYFDGTGNQLITNNQNTYFIRLGTNSTEIGRYNNPTVTVTANNTSAMQVFGNLNINGTSTLDLGAYTLNRSAAGGTLTLASGATLKLAASSGGQTGSNFPSNFTNYNLNTTSTVEYNSLTGVNQTIYDVPYPGYGNLTLSNSSGAGSTTKTAGNSLDIRGNFTVNDAFTTFNGATSLAHTIYGNWSNNGVAVNYTTSNIIIMKGTSAQSIGGTAATTFNNLTINNSSTGVTLNKNISVSGVLNLNDGNLFTDATNIITMSAGSSVGAVTDNSFVSGPVAKVGSTDFIFPVGKDAQYRPINITTLSGSETFTAQYFHFNPDLSNAQDPGAPYSAVSKDPAIDHIGGNEYWILNRTGVQTAFVTLSWNSYSGAVDNLANLIVSKWDGSTWKDLGNGATTGSVSPGTGTVKTSATVSAFSPFTLGSKTSSNPLPVELLRFIAFPENADVKVIWGTVAETNSNYFSVERCKNNCFNNDFKNWEVIATVDGAGNSNRQIDYSAYDKNPFPGLSYYRLKQTDYDGISKYFDPVAVRFDSEKQISAEIYPNPSDGAFNLVLSGFEKDENIHIALVNSLGTVVYSSDAGAGENENLTATIRVAEHFPAGVYLMEITTSRSTFKKKIIIK